jgi:hypothetical protein
MDMKMIGCLLAGTLALHHPVALGQDSTARGSQGLSEASQASLAASGFVVAGSAALIVSGAQLTVTALQTAGESVVIVMRGASEAATVSVRTSAQIAGEASVAVGTVVRVVAESVGYALYVGAKLIAFVPNEIGRALIHHSVRDGRPR